MDPKILLVDDSKTMRGLITRQLNLAGYMQVEHAADAPSALEMLAQNNYDLVLSDWNMPKVSGLDMVKTIRQQDAYNHIPVLMVTTRNEREDVVAAMQAQVDGYLAKPFGPQELVEKIQGALKARSESKKTAGFPSAEDVRIQIRDLSDIPALSATYVQAVKMLVEEDERVNLDALAILLQADAGLSLRIMRVARSAFFGFTGDYLKTALTFLGVPNVRRIVQSAAIMQVMGDSAEVGLNRSKFWQHSLACGIVMQMLSRDNQHARHFMVGMLHDIGKLVLDIKFPDAYLQILKLALEEKRPLHVVEKEKLGITHAEVGQEIILKWQLPNEFAEVTVMHHAPSEGVRNQYLCSLVYLADIAVRKMEIGESGNFSPPIVVDPYARRIGISIDDAINRKDEVVAQVEALTH